jgi:hypothetical protein
MDSTHLDHTARQHWVDRHAPYSPVPLSTTPYLRLRMPYSSASVVACSGCWEWRQPFPHEAFLERCEVPVMICEPAERPEKWPWSFGENPSRGGSSNKAWGPPLAARILARAHLPSPGLLAVIEV